MSGVANNPDSWSFQNPIFHGYNFPDGVLYRANLVWDTNALAWVKETQPGGGAGGGAATIADGADVAEGATTDVAVATDANGTVSAKLRGLIKNQVASMGFNVPANDYVSLAQDATHDTYTFKSGGSGGTTVATVTITYTDGTKVTLSTIART